LYRYNYDLTKLHQPRIYIEDSNVNSHESIFYNIEGDFEKLHLVELYQSHIDIVNEIEWKKQIYSENYKNEINKLIESAGLNLLTEDEINRIITGVYTNIEDYGQRPLSKLITDISKNVGLI
jgi:Glu-tRNA(Gln) amidotransferase subunit E-like FAD-binding protein